MKRVWMVLLLWGRWTVQWKRDTAPPCESGTVELSERDRWLVVAFNSFNVTPGEILPLVFASRLLLRFSVGGQTELLQTLTWANNISRSQRPPTDKRHSVWVNLANGLLLCPSTECVLHGFRMFADCTFVSWTEARGLKQRYKKELRKCLKCVTVRLCICWG